GVGADSSCPYISVINSVGDCHHFVGGIHCMWGFVCHFVGVYSLYVGVFVYAGAINRPLQLRTDCQNIADGLR
ncbi:hypothetical protein, partial [Prevotella pallens]|uniref:hypothetical protein n=1 Tax=Prevotella pallens TaxID=60133 RepID=UPI0028D30D1F